MSYNKFFAHSVPGSNCSAWEELRRHLEEVAEETAARAAKFGCAALGEALGRLHDLGKYKGPFQRYIRGEPAGGDKSHSTAGALYARKNLNWFGLVLSHAIAGHHAGLQDGLFARDGRLEQMSDDLAAALAGHVAACDDMVLPTGAIVPDRAFRGDGGRGSASGFQSAFLTRMLFSCLVDADRFCTARFVGRAAGTWVDPPALPTVPALADRLAEALAADEAKRVEKGIANTAVNRLRRRVFDHVIAQATREPGIFTLTVPTGGGKTLTGLSFALEHAREHGKERIVVVIPFTSIIEQNAQVFRDKLGDLQHAVLEHHSAFEESEESRARHRGDVEREGGDPERRRLATETWDAPIVVTTAVQFFESLFAARTTRCRKLHNLCNSVIVLDEAQTLPLTLLRPCVAALKELARNYGCSIVLSTATQPALTVRSDAPERSFTGGFENVRELAPDVAALFAGLRRVHVVQAGPQKDDDLYGRFVTAPQALCIVNTRCHAQKLFTAIRELEGSRHLSTLMTPAHRARTIVGIRTDLKEGRACRVVSTSLIEAGVDVDFPFGMRAEIGLDQLAQTAGRINREGRRDPDASTLLVFSSPDHAPPKVLETQVTQGHAALERFAARPFDPDAIASYFEAVYWKTKEDHDRPGVLAACDQAKISLDFPFASMADWVRLVDSPLRPVIVCDDAVGDPDGEAGRWVEELERPWSAHRLGAIARALQRHTVGIPPKAWRALAGAGALRLIRESEFGDQFAVVTNARLYRSDVGLTFDDPHVLDAEGLVI